MVEQHERIALHPAAPFVLEQLDLRDSAKRKAGPSFDLKKYNDQVISYGSTPVKYVRELMGL